MLQILALLLSLPFVLFADFDDIFPRNENLAVVQHVNVVTGHLGLSMDDALVQGALPLHIKRSYSSRSALEGLHHDADLKLQQERRGWMFLGGWDLYNYTNLLVEPDRNKKNYAAYIADGSGQMICYRYSHRKGDSKFAFFLKPVGMVTGPNGSYSAVTDARNNCIFLDTNGQVPSLSTPDGGFKYFIGRRFTDYENRDLSKHKHFFRLSEEVLPSQHKVLYHYSKDGDLQRIELTNPHKTKVFASINFQPLRMAGEPFRLRATTSDGKEITYSLASQGKRHYLQEVSSASRPHECCHYVSMQEGAGARIEAFSLADSKQFHVKYYAPTDRAMAIRWLSEAHTKPYEADRVMAIEAPVGPDGSMIAVARFSYTPKATDVLNADGLLTRYHHDLERLLQIDRFDKEGRLYSVQKLYWDDGRVICKALFEGTGRAVVAKTYLYDERGNVIEEALHGDLTGHCVVPLFIDDRGHPTGGESYKKSYSYWPAYNVVREEREEGGLVHNYAYKSGTNLLAAKITSYEGKILQRHFYSYNDDNLLVAEIDDDGEAREPSDLRGVRLRTERLYERDPVNGLVLAVTELHGGRQTHRRVYTYSAEKKIIAEALFGTDNQLLYTLRTDYDSHGNVIRQTTPRGAENVWIYDSLNHLVAEKEVGSSFVSYSYDAAGRRVSSQKGNRTTALSYDLHGNLIAEQTDAATTRYQFDEFKRKVLTISPEITDENGAVASLSAARAYDTRGNCVATALVATAYTAWNKPVYEVTVEGARTNYYYHTNGQLVKKILPDGTEEEYIYDPFGRMRERQVYSSMGDILETEEWEYAGFYLLSYTNPRGLKTHYTYDERGRKIAEEAAGRKISYTYDQYGYLQRLSSRVQSHVTLCDADGRLLEEWDEDASGLKEKHKLFVYDAENRKIFASIYTDQGEAKTGYNYDDEGRLVSQISPEGSITHYIYEGAKTTITDPLGLKTVVTKDVLGRDRLLEKFSPDDELLYKEERFYNIQGFLARKAIAKLGQSTETLYSYDAFGRVVSESEKGKSCSYAYDNRGRLTKKVLPGYVTLSYTYDGLGRLLTQISSDGSINQHYDYLHGSDPIKILDRGVVLRRGYDIFGHLISEANGHTFLSWTYDDLGRMTSFQLPDRSRIVYLYEGKHLRAVQRLSASEEILYEHIYKAYDSQGYVKEELLINDLGSIVTTYDLEQRPTHQSSSWVSYAVSYNSIGHVSLISSSLFGEKSPIYNRLNEVVEETRDEGEVILDLAGHIVKRVLPAETISYRYDALGRLIETISPKKQRICYTYDPLSRLLSEDTYSYSQGRWKAADTYCYIYNQEEKVGILSPSGAIHSLTVTSPHHAVAYEIDGIAFAPLYSPLDKTWLGLISQEGRLTLSP